MGYLYPVTGKPLQRLIKSGLIVCLMLYVITSSPLVVCQLLTLQQVRVGWGHHVVSQNMDDYLPGKGYP